MQFEYDEKGGSFYYFLLSFYVLILIPFTIFVCGRKSSKEKSQKNQNICRCYLCRVKRHYLKSNNPWKYRKQKLLRCALIVAWVLFVVLLYKVSQVEMEWAEFDPFKELGVDRGASVAEVKKAYRGLTMLHHPDRGGDPKRFMRIAKAYAALTDDQARKNWEDHGNPDGPGAAQFGIALPKWIIEKKNSIWVLGIYTFVFMILLPVGVGTWWYRSIKYGGEEVLLNTIRLYYCVFRNASNFVLPRGLTILCGSLEFEKGHNPEIQERPSDNFELPQLLKLLPNFNIKSKEKPFCYPYSVKARLLVYAHLNRMEIPPNTLELDRRYVVKKCPYLINQMVNMIAYVVCLGNNGQQHVPNVETLENVMRLSPMIVQALWDRQSALLQLPHITEDMLRHFVTRKRNIKTVRLLMEMKEDERRALLRTLTDEQYHDVMAVAGAMPHVDMFVDTAVIDDDDQTITAGSLVTVSVLLKRRNMSCFRPQPDFSAARALSGAGDAAMSEPTSPDQFSLCQPPGNSKWDAEDAEEEEEEAGAGRDAAGAKLVNGAAQQDSAGAAANANAGAGGGASTPKKSAAPRPWQKNRGKKKGPGGGGGKHPHKRKAAAAHQQHQQQQQQAAAAAAAAAAKAPAIKEERKEVEEVEEEERPSQRSSEEDHDGSGSDDSDQVSSSRPNGSEKRRQHRRNAGGGPTDSEGNEERDSDNEEGWQRFQADVKKENSLETKETTKHTVHCPYYPAEKLEYWWLYIADKKTRTLVTTPIQIRSLQDEERVPLKVTAPMVPGQYVFTVCLRSDSYLQLDVFQNIKMDVLEARVVEDHPQWEISDDEDDVGRQASGSDHEGDNTDDSDYDYSD